VPSVAGIWRIKIILAAVNALAVVQGTKDVHIYLKNVLVLIIVQKAMPPFVLNATSIPANKSTGLTRDIEITIK